MAKNESGLQEKGTSIYLLRNKSRGSGIFLKLEIFIPTSSCGQLLEIPK
jgi:hypothetical protein